MAHHTKDKGDLGVFKVQLNLHNQGWMILCPQTEHSPFDLVAYKDGVFRRIQVKYRTMSNGVVSLQMATTWTDKQGNHRKLYDRNQVDVMCIYCPDTDECYYIDISIIIGNVFNIRINATKNNQVAKIRMASDYTELK